MPQVKIIKLNSNQLAEIVTVLKNGGLVIYPTETVYGVGVDATNPKAVKKLLNYKSRREGKPLSIAVSNMEMAKKYIELNEQAEKMYKNFLPGPYTIVSNILESQTDNQANKNKLALGVKSEFNTLGIRIPDYPLVVEIVKALDEPITATSANASGKKRPYKIQDIFDNLSNKQKSLIDLVVDAGDLPRNEPSTVIDTTLSTPMVVRGVVANDGKNKKQNIELTTNSPQETQDLAGKILLKNWDQVQKTGLIIGLDGELGAGKTIFTKGLAKFLKITDTVTSPTYLYHLEYPYNRHGATGLLHHLDVWKVDNEASFKLLKIEKLIKPGNIIVIEWWQQVKKFWDSAESSQDFNQTPMQAPIINILLEEKAENQRDIFIS